MSEQFSLLTRIEDKIRTIGERLVTVTSENASLKEEINALNNKIADLEQIFDESKSNQNGMKADQIDTVKKELDKYITEVEHCIELVKEI